MNLYDDEKALEELQRAMSSGSTNVLSKALVTNIWPLYCEHYELLVAAVESLPVQVLERFPVLRVVHPMTPVLARTTRPFKPLMNQDEARTMTPIELDTFTLVQMVSFRFSGDIAAALMFSGRLEDRIVNVRSESRERADGPLWFYRDQIGVTKLLAGDSSGALLEFGSALQLGRLAKQRDAARVALGHTALAHAVRGSLDSAVAALVETSAMAVPSAGHAEACAITERTAAALVAVERLDETRDELIAELGPPDCIQLTWPFALLARVRSLLAEQRPADALELIWLTDNAHPQQRGSVATDIFVSLKIDALNASGDMRAAWKLADRSGQAGTMTRFAMVRLALQDSRFELVHDLLRRANAHPLSPGQQVESGLLSAWLEVAQTGELERQAAVKIARLALSGNTRRLLGSMPRQVVEQVKANIFGDEASRFDELTAELSHIELQPRPSLTPGELRVLTALPVHTTTAAIALAFHVSPNTIKSQLKALYRKLECSSREGAIKAALQHRILDDDLDVHGSPLGGISGNEILRARAY